MSKSDRTGDRLNLTVPKIYSALLSAWAASDGDAKASIALRLVMDGVDAAVKSGRIPMGIDRYKSLAHLVLENWDKLLEESEIESDRLHSIRNGDRPNEVELLKIACVMRVGLQEIRALPIIQNGGDRHEASRT